MAPFFLLLSPFFYYKKRPRLASSFLFFYSFFHSIPFIASSDYSSLPPFSILPSTRFHLLSLHPTPPHLNQSLSLSLSLSLIQSISMSSSLLLILSYLFSVQYSITQFCKALFSSSTPPPLSFYPYSLSHNPPFLSYISSFLSSIFLFYFLYLDHTLSLILKNKIKFVVSKSQKSFKFPFSCYSTLISKLNAEKHIREHK